MAPHLPESWTSVGSCVQGRGRRLKIRIGQGDRRLEATLGSGSPMTLLVDGVSQELPDDCALHVFSEGLTSGPPIEAGD